MPETPEPTQLATSFVHLIQRFTGNQPDALKQMRRQIEAEREAGRQMVERAEAQLVALDQLEALIEEGRGDGAAEVPSMPKPPLKAAILLVLNEDPDTAWHRDELFAELTRRGWAPGGTNPRNTFTSRLRDLELDERLRRIDRDTFAATKNEGALAM